MSQSYSNEPPEHPSSYGPQSVVPTPGGQSFPMGPAQSTPPYPPRKPGKVSVFKALFDFQFRVFITTDVMRLLYIATMGLYGIGFIGMLVRALKDLSDTRPGGGGTEFFMTFMLIPMAFGALLGLVLIRVFFELLLVWFRVAELLIAQQEQRELR